MDVPSKRDVFALVGLDLQDPATLDRTPNQKLRSILLADQELTADCFRNRKTNEELLQANLVERQDMLVCRLDKSYNNGLLLYNPCRMHPKLIEWLNLLGTVEWIVSGSASHTNQLPQAARAFPSAKILCAGFANKKCACVGMRPADYIYTDHDPSSLKGFYAAHRLLQSHGIVIYHVNGDCVTQALCVLAHGHLLEVDLLYGHYNGTIHATAEPAEWESHRACGNVQHKRLYYYSSIAQDASSNGCLPDFRVMSMDPNSTFAPLLIDKPQESNCREMASSMRQLLKLKFDFVDSGHSDLEGSLPAEVFRKSIDKSWNWLDGDSLLV